MHLGRRKAKVGAGEDGGGVPSSFWKHSLEKEKR
jgi:hypothetical protein